MNLHQRSRLNRFGSFAFALTIGLATFAGCTGNNGSGGNSSASNRPGTTTNAASPPNSLSTEESANPLWGNWSAPCDRIMAALVGESFEEMTCTGTYVIGFKPDGTFVQTAGGTSTVRSPDGGFSQTLPWSANYTATFSTDGDQMRIGGSASAPVSITPDELDEAGDPMVASLTNTGMFPFSLNGDTLTLQPTFPTIGKVTLIYSRSG